MNTEHEIQLGQKAECAVTGFKGVVTGRAQYLNGAVLYLLCPPVDKDGKQVDCEWVDRTQARVTDIEFLDLPGGYPEDKPLDAPPVSEHNRPG